jgi:hypothetical protein
MLSENFTGRGGVDIEREIAISAGRFVSEKKREFLLRVRIFTSPPLSPSPDEAVRRRGGII